MGCVKKACHRDRARGKEEKEKREARPSWRVVCFPNSVGGGADGDAAEQFRDLPI